MSLAADKIDVHGKFVVRIGGIYLDHDADRFKLVYVRLLGRRLIALKQRLYLY